MKKINLYLLNEHNEALYFWTKEVAEKKIKNVTLLHVDPHDDLAIPGVLEESSFKNLNSVRRLSKNSTIGNFIVPALFSSI